MLTLVNSTEFELKMTRSEYTIICSPIKKSFTVNQISDTLNTQLNIEL